jgi:hypothetical protein
MALVRSLDQLTFPPSTPAQRMRQALALFEDGLDMKRRSLKRKSPSASEAELQAQLLRWLQQEDES